MTITTELVVFILAILGALGGVWARIETIVSRARSEALLAANTAASRADVVAAGLSDLRLHVAQSYVSKEGLREQMSQLVDLVRDVQNDVGQVNSRLDRVIEGRSRSAHPRKPP